MTPRQAEIERRLTEDVQRNDSDLAAMIAELTSAAHEQADLNAADWSTLTGELAGEVGVNLADNERAMSKPAARIRDAVEGKLTDNYRDLAGGGYEPQVYYADVQSALASGDPVGTLIRQLTTAARTQGTGDDAGAVNDAYRNGSEVSLPATPAGPSGQDVPIPVPGLLDHCRPAGELDPLNPGRLICERPGQGVPGVQTAVPGEIPPPSASEGPSCPAPDIVIPQCPAPIIFVQPQPLPVPPDDGRTPADYPQPEEPVCPEQEPPIVNVGGPVVTVNVPDPARQPRLRLDGLDVRPQAAGAVEWDKDDGCDKAEDLCDRWNTLINATSGSGQDVADVASGAFGRWVSNRLGIHQSTAGIGLNLAFSFWNDLNTDSREAFTARVVAAGFSNVRLLYANMVETFGGDVGCAMGPATFKANWVNLTKDVGFDIEYFTQPLTYEYQYLFPVYIPPQPEIDRMYLGDRITPEQFECYTKAQGNLPNLHRLAMEEKRERLRVDEWIEAWRRGQVDEDRVFREARRLGWLDRSEVAQKMQLTEAVPPFGDVIRFMVRDVENEAAIRAGQLLDGFKENFKGQLQAWATANGISEDLARKYWVAHWQWISNTQGYTMIHRLRPGRVDPGLVTTAETIREVLKINDVAPAFIDRLIAISYAPLTRVDVRRAYEIGVLDRAAVKDAYLDLGYDETNAETLTRYTEKDIERKQERAVKVWSLSSIASAYQAGTIDSSFAFSRARLLLPSDEAVERFLRDVDVKRESESKKACIKAVKKRFMVGELTTLQAQDEVSSYTFDRRTAEVIVAGWDCERSARRREVAAGVLCKWLSQGLISTAQYAVRLQNLGYTPEDGQRMIQSCGQDIFEKERKAALTAARQNLQQYNKLIEEKKKAIKELEKKLKELQNKLAPSPTAG